MKNPLLLTGILIVGLMTGCASLPAPPRMQAENLTDRSFDLTGKKIAVISAENATISQNFNRQLIHYLNSVPGLSLVRPEVTDQISEYYAIDFERWISGLGQDGQDNQFLSRISASLGVDYLLIGWLDKIMLTQRKAARNSWGSDSDTYDTTIRLIPVDCADGALLKMLTQKSSFSKSKGCGLLFVKDKPEGKDMDFIDKAAYDTASSLHRQFMTQP